MQDNYQPPAADVTPRYADDAAEQELAAFVGPRNTEYYLERSRQIAAGGSAAWHWPAFFITSGWLLYRKMWFYALAYIVLLPVVLAAVTAALVFVVGEGVADVLLQLIYLLIAFVAVPIAANRIYLRHARNRIAKAAAGARDEAGRQRAIAAAGGTNLFAALLLLLVPLAGVFAAIFVPAYQDYAIRAQVAEGLTLASTIRPLVVDYRTENGVFPADAAALELPGDQFSGSYVAGIDIENGVIRIRYGNEANALISGSSLMLEPSIRAADVVAWSCRSDTIESKWLPSACGD